ncbi:MAG: flagellar hook-associated protein FlgK [Nitrospinae bacterium]|nr:flagellar hook-associated protein FlgK [Nitrospinota bacterium]
MPNIYGAMNTAKVALMAHQLSLEVTGQNIANVNNADYTKQEVQLEAAFPIRAGGSPGLVGTGVRATAIVRRFDQFLEGQRTLNKSNTGYWDARQDFMARLEVVFNESGTNGLNGLFDNFFKSWQDLASNAKGLTERTDVVAQGRNLSNMFNKVNQDVKNLRVDLNTKITSSITEINRITGEIANLNAVIHEAEAQNVHANDFRDKRESLVRELSSYVQVNTVEDPTNKEITLSLNNGRALVIGQTAFTLSARQRSDDGLASDIFWRDTSGQEFNITSEFSNGSMGSWIDMRDTDMTSYLDKLDQLSATLIRDINNIHSSGYGLDGSTGQDFFTGFNMVTTANRNNTGTGTITGSIVAPDTLNVHKFQIEFTAPGSYDIRDVTTGSVVATEAYGGGPQVSSYLLGQGMQVTINGAPAANDKFIVNPAADASLNMAVHSAVVTDSNKIAAGLTTNQGDGDNALLLAQLQNSMTMNQATPGASGTATFAQFYNSIVGEAGVASKQAMSAFTQQEGINVEIERRREQVGGVSLDEESMNLIKFQHAYQAAARMVNVVDELLQTLLGMGA